MLRTHDVVVADGCFRVVLTPKRRVVAVLDAHETLLGPVHIALEVGLDRFLPPHAPVATHRAHTTAGIFDDIGHAAESAFHAASHVATQIAKPTLGTLQHAASDAAHAIAHSASMLPDAARRQLEAASRVVMRAKLGDLDAKNFIRGIANAAKAGVSSATHVADALLDASKMVAHVDPTLLIKHVPGIGGALGSTLEALSPLQKFGHVVSAIQRGDFATLGRLAKSELAQAQGVLSMMPGVGTGISAAIASGLAALEGGKPLEIAIRAAYGAIPIPPGLRALTDSAVDAVLALAARPHDLTDVAIQAARDHVPAGLPRDVFDTLVHLIAHKVPVQKSGLSIIDHYVRQYADKGAGLHVDDALRHLAHTLGHHPFAIN